MLFETEQMPLRQDADGVIRVSGTRIPIDTIVIVFDQGATVEEIVQRFPTLDLADVYFVVGYYLRHRSDVETYLRERRQQAVEVRRQNEQRFSPHGIRERLIARSVKQKADSDASTSR